MDLEKKTDEELMLEYAAGNVEAFEELHRRYGKKIYNLFLRSLRSGEHAQDLLQECFLRIIEARGRYQPRKAFSSWIFTIAMNLIRDKYREKQRRQVNLGADSFDEDSIQVAALENDPNQTMEKIQIKEAVEKALQTLPVEQRQVIILSKYNGLSFLEIAKILKISPVAAKQKAYRGMQNLKTKLAHLAEE